MDMTRKVLSCSVLALGIGVLPSLFVTGCGKKEKAEAPASVQDVEAERQKIQAELDEGFRKVAGAAQEKKWDEALKLVAGFESNPRYAEYSGRCFMARVALLLESGEREKACDAALARWKAGDAATARDAFRQIHSFFLRGDDRERAHAWAKRLSDPREGMPGDVLAETAGWRLDLAVQEADADSAVAVLNGLFDRLRPEQCLALVGRYLGRCLDAGRFELFQASLDALEKDPKFHDGAFKRCFSGLRLRSAIAQKKWEVLPQALEECRAALPDGELKALLSGAFQQLRKLEQGALVETLAGAVFRAEKEKTASRNFAARVWVGACLPGRCDEIPARLAEVEKGGLPPAEIARLFERYFYELHDRPAGLAKMCEIGERLLAKTADDDERGSIALKLLDGAFILNRLSKAVDMLEKGIPGKDAGWHAMTLPKVKGHAALQAAGNCTDAGEKKTLTLAAIESFKQFMKAIQAKEGQDDEFDPTTGVAYSREWILARNADRISKLYSEIGDAAGAAAMRAEAKGFYEAALKKADGEAGALDLLRKEVAPYGLKAPASSEGAKK